MAGAALIHQVYECYKIKIQYWKSEKMMRETAQLTATYFFFPKKHMPMLFQRGGLSGTAQAATRYLFMATSKSPWACIMLPAARMAWERKQRGEGDEKERYT